MIMQPWSTLDDATVREVAEIRAGATGHRDGTSTNVDAAEAGIRRRLALEDAAMITVRQDDRVAGFALVAPRTQTLELFHLAVDPAAWGLGLAAELLRAVDSHARSAGRAILELWVIDDNERAAAVYERAGWDPHRRDAARRDIRSDRAAPRAVSLVGP